jgi:hypothetical protein
MSNMSHCADRNAHHAADCECPSGSLSLEEQEEWEAAARSRSSGSEERGLSALRLSILEAKSGVCLHSDYLS